MISAAKRIVTTTDTLESGNMTITEIFFGEYIFDLGGDSDDA